MDTVIRTVDELLNESISYVTEDANCFYVMLDIRPGEIFHDEIWVVDKKTKSVKYMPAISYTLDIHDQTKPVDIAIFKRSLK